MLRRATLLVTLATAAAAAAGLFGAPGVAAVGVASQGSAGVAEIDWYPVADLNAELPETIRVFAGTNDEPPLRAWYVSIRGAPPGVTSRVLVSDDPADRRETVSSFARDTGACVVVNGGYFVMDRTPAGHAGLLVAEGTVEEPATRSVRRDGVRYEVARAAIGFTDEHTVDVAWITTRDGILYTWPEPPGHRPGTPAPPLSYEHAKRWEVRDAIGAGPALVVDGEVRVTTDEEVFFGSSIPDTHPRTAAGVAADGSLLLLVVDGRQPASRGVTLEELAALMTGIGAVEALNLDGGGSSTLVVNNRLVNRPAGGIFQREVMSAIGTFCR